MRHIKNLARAKADAPIIQIGIHTITDDNRDGEAWFTLGKSMLALPNHLCVIHIHRNGFQEDLLCDRANADQPLIA